MTNEELILQRLDAIDAKLVPLSASAASLQELKEDLTPRVNEACKVVMKELLDVESVFQMEDLFRLAKRGIRSVRNLTFALEQLENMIDFITTVEPLLKSTVPKLIHYLDELEQQDVFRTYTAMMGVRVKVAAEYGPEDFEAIGDGFVATLGLLKKMAQPEVMAFLNRLMSIPAEVDFKASKSVGPFGMLSACSKEEVKAGLGVVMELTKALGKFKEAEPAGLVGSQ